jgi:hypothetical protein
MQAPIKTLLYSLSFVFVLTNIIYLAVLFYKMPAIDDVKLEEATEEAAKYLYDVQYAKPVPPEEKQKF